MTIKKIALNLCASVILFTPLASFANKVDAAKIETNIINTVAKIDWQPCFTNDNPNLLCAKFAVPLSYQQYGFDKSTKKKINISLIKLPANNPAKQKLGSLFLNPGGPGGSGVDFVHYAGQYLFNHDIRDQYDLIGFDPRGINTSEPLTCGISLEDAIANHLDASFPVTAAEEAQRFKSDAFINSRCAANANPIIDHMSTADVARDLDLLRQAVGDKLLHYVGYSYGSYVGVTYANLFPQNVGHLVVDGVLNPIEWSTGRGLESWFVPVTTRLGSDKGAMATLKEFFRLCDLAGTAGCAFSGNSAARYDAMLQRLKQHPLPIILPTGETLELTYAITVSATLSAMYNSFGWTDFAGLLAGIEAQFPPAEIGKKYAHFLNETGTETIPPFDNFLNFQGVLCADSNNPLDREFWPLAAKWAEHENGYFGRTWTWSSSTCANWPGSQNSRYSGPFTKKTKNPVLVASTLYDPATPYSGAKTVAKLLPNSRLVTVVGWGHTTPGLSFCADQITSNYLLTGELPEKNTVCEQGFSPFDLPRSANGFAVTTDEVDVSEISSARQVTTKVDENSDAARVRKAILRNTHWH